MKAGSRLIDAPSAGLVGHDHMSRPSHSYLAAYILCRPIGGAQDIGSALDHRQCVVDYNWQTDYRSNRERRGKWLSGPRSARAFTHCPVDPTTAGM
jgi:hypothetical protein